MTKKLNKRTQPKPQNVSRASAGQELTAALKTRMNTVALNEREDESLEDEIVTLANDVDEFRLRLDLTIAEFFSSNARTTERELVRHFLELAQRLVLPSTFAPIQTWFLRNASVLRKPDPFRLGWSALGAMATTQTRGIEANAQFWLRQWQQAPVDWAPRCFIGLRLQSPDLAAAELPHLLERAGDNAATMLAGLSSQPDGQQAIERWLAEAPDGEAKARVRMLLETVAPASTRVPLRKTRPSIFGKGVVRQPVAFV